jgi:hypothetical protein
MPRFRRETAQEQGQAGMRARDPIVLLARIHTLHLTGCRRADG